MRVTFDVAGPLIWLDENGQPTGYFDVFDYITLGKEHHQRAGIGGSYIEGQFR
jgi:2,4'-dihydroxyacetophenone dioxygenase